MHDVFDVKTISPMLIAEQREAFDSTDYRYEIKMDGVRCLAYLGGGEIELRNKRNLRVTAKYPELADMHRQADGRCILDGELVVIKNGKSEFAEIQRRALMSDRFKIRLASKLPVTFVAFDMLYLNGDSLTGCPLEERQERLHGAISASDRLTISRSIEGHGKALFELTVQHGLEGVVAKRKGSFYYPGRRSKDWIKFKNLQDEDYVICGYIVNVGDMDSLVLGQYRGGALSYKGHVTIGPGENHRRVMALPVLSEPPYQAPPGNENAVWVEQGLVCTVKYLESLSNGMMRHPVFKGLRDDKAPAECIDKDEL